MGALNRRPGAWSLARVSRALPGAGRAPAAAAGSALGGQQHMVAIGRALVSNPEASAVRRDLARAGAARGRSDLRVARHIRAEGASIVLVEQDVKRAAGAADRVYCLLRVTGDLARTGARPGTSSSSARAYFGA
mgnify:CR=1 FL=1